MTVAELISNWTEEERRLHANLIAECLNREQFLNDFKGRMETSEEELKKSLEHLLRGLNNLIEIVNVNEDRWQNIYLVKGKGNA